MKYFYRFFILSSIILLFQPALAARVDTVETFSTAMNKKIKAVMIFPEDYSTGKEFPVVYLLHGHGNNYRAWSKVPFLTEAADKYHMILVCPDGGYSSWYFDSPEDSKWKYETYVSDELVKWVDKNYKTRKSREGRAITGLSMGGHGALYLAFRHQDVFGAAGSMSGGVDFRPFPNNWDIAARLGRYSEYPERWEQNTVINMLHLLTPGSLSLIIDCGTEDFFYKVNENLHSKLIDRNIPHDYITRQGAHNWNYWNNSVKYQLLFMNEFFSRK
ncbi:alpha/beta hydrolase [Arcticibacter tournemirensis]